MLVGLFKNGSGNTSSKIALLVLTGSCYHHYQRRYTSGNKNVMVYKLIYARQTRFKEVGFFILQ